ncbi:MAG: class I SAM-dependent methyltransferase [Actinomycetota bacterium]|nr:class I SAM-dependent methyltransferase [Actinomycetota bacterium]
MDEYNASTYGDRIADVYDDWYEDVFDTEGAVDLLARLADGGRALELAIGTGRVAVPLAGAGVEVHGIDASEAMVAKLRAKQNGNAIPVAMGDFTDVNVEGKFSLIYVVFNTFFALSSQRDQVTCFRNVAEHLNDDGAFVIEAFVPDPTRFDRGQRVDAGRVESGEVVIDASRHDPVNQRAHSSHIRITEQGIRLFPVQIRYAWPSELDLMAELAGLVLKERWSGWRGQSFNASSEAHVSVYGRP